MAIQKPVQPITADADDFTLTVDQMVFMINADNAMRKAEAEGNVEFFRDLASSPEYKSLFGNMSIDQAIDRYELMIGQDI
jgi:hypothetical protein